MIEIRVARADDAEPARSLMEALGYAVLDRDAFARGFDAVLACETERLFVAEVHAGVVGLLSLSWRPQLRLAGLLASVDELVVSPKARGLGVGRALVDAAKRAAMELGARRLELHTQRARESYARGFYAKNGFVEIDSAVMRAPLHGAD